MISKRRAITVMGSILAVILLVFAFHNVDGQGLKRQLLCMDWRVTIVMALLSLAGLFCRGWRWWLLLARPVHLSEFWGVQRALAVSYAVGNLVSRLAEVVRIAIAHSETKRDIGALTGTVVLDRLLFDGLTFGLMLISALMWNRELMMAILPNAMSFIWILTSLLALGCVGLVCLAFFPNWVRVWLIRFKLDRIPKIGHLLEAWVDQLNLGLHVLARPGYLLAAVAVNGIVWLLPFTYFCIALGVFGVEASLAEAWFVFTLTVVGVLIPSPGGLGSYHLMVTLGLTQLLHVDTVQAAAIALVTHGINYIMLFLAGVPAWWISRQGINRKHLTDKLVQ